MYIWERFNIFQKGIRSRFSLFAKINLLIVILFIPILIMYTYSNNVTYDVVSKELQVSNTKQLTFLSSQIDSRINQMMDFSLILSRDPNVRALRPPDPPVSMDRCRTLRVHIGNPWTSALLRSPFSHLNSTASRSMFRCLTDIPNVSVVC